MTDRNPTVVFVEPEKPIIEDRPVPCPADHELLIRTQTTLISTGTELTVLRGKYPEGSHWADYGKLPFLPGYDNVGVVVDAGKAISRAWIGRRVATYGTHAAYVTFDGGLARPIHRAIADEEAVFVSISDIVMNGVRRAGVRWGDSVVVYGLGLLGQLTVQLCRFCGAWPVFGVDVADSRLDYLPKRPGIVPVNPAREDVSSVVKAATNERMADVVFEVTGDPELIVKEFEVLRRQGKFVVLSSPRGKTLFDFHDLCNAPSYDIIGVHAMSAPTVPTLENPWTAKRHSELFFDLVADGELSVKSLISHRESFREAANLYHMLLADRSRAMGVVMDWTDRPSLE
ncbi:MAG: zinc-binding alcohol dehydrogenase [Pirellulaceae bacterium]|nr:zinc-binding alcohol dehydrogenase [Pirellulaceae bacterium]